VREGTPVIAPLDPAKPKDPVGALLDRAIQAFGGANQFTRWRCGHIVYTARSIPSPVGDREALVEEFFDYPGRFKRIAAINAAALNAGRQSVWCYNGDKAWERSADRPAKALPANAKVTTRRAHQFLDLFNLPVLKTEASNYTFAGAGSLDGRAVWGLKSKKAEGQTDSPQLREAFFDQKSFLLLRTQSHATNKLLGLLPQEVESVTSYNDSQDIGGGMVPMHIVGTANGREITNVWILTLEFNEHIQTSTFE